ncbi:MULTISPECIES: NAD(P)-dependent oxidoreductase [Bacillus]|uniref:NAD(P)-dependent oxidoreductase n=1 Tax=Bacillus TaxID=1386 RepID=UPI000BB6E2ED|nr:MULTISPECIES: NAD(P)-dependent oxidoreductase [Bacillus]
MNKVFSTITFIGTGVMGNSMASHLLLAGYNVHIYTRTKEKANNLILKGAKWFHSPKEAVQEADVVITMVGYPSDVEQVYLGQDGIVQHANTDTFLIDMTTSTPTLAKEIFEKAKERGLRSLDAPVSGGDIGARDAKLTIMAGGDEGDFHAVESLLKHLGTNIVYQGPAGSGQHTKMCNQIAIATNMIGVCEALAYAKAAGLNPENVLKSISAGAAGSWSLSNLAPRMINGNFEPGFYIKHFVKDMKIAIDEAEKMDIPVPGLQLAKELYEKLIVLGEEDSGTQALYKLW